VDPSLYTDEAIAARRAAAQAAAQAAADAKAARLAVVTRALPHLLAGAGWVLLTVAAQHAVVGAQKPPRPTPKSNDSLKASCVAALKKILKDPYSYRMDPDDSLIVLSESRKEIQFFWNYRAKNSFGGYGEPGSAYCVVSKMGGDTARIVEFPENLVD